MDDAITTLELQMKRVVNDLEYTSHTLENEFRSARSTSTSTTTTTTIDVVALVRRISALETSLLATKKRSEDLLASRHRVTSAAAAVMLQNHARLARLLADGDGNDSSDDKENHGSETDGDFNEARDELVSVLRECSFGVDVSKYAVPTPPPTTTTSPALPDAAPSSSSVVPLATTTVADTVAPSQPLPPKPPLPSVSAAPFDEVTASQFEAVPVSTRGRCKLADVQAVLSRLVAHYTASAAAAAAKKGGGGKRVSTVGGGSGGVTLAVLHAVPALSLQELGKESLKVMGKTGDCVVGALRALGLVKAVKAPASGGSNPGGGGGGFTDGAAGAGHGLAPGLLLSDAAVLSLYQRLK